MADPMKKVSAGKKRSSSAPPVLQSPKKYLKWSNEYMEKELQAVKVRQCKKLSLVVVALF